MIIISCGRLVEEIKKLSTETLALLPTLQVMKERCRKIIDANLSKPPEKPGAPKINLSSDQINDVYKPILNDIQELFKKASKLNRRNALMAYIEKRKFIKALRSFFSKRKPEKGRISSKDFFKHNQDASYETVKNRVVDELLKLKKPSEIALCLTSAHLDTGGRTLKELRALK